jgi:hypothetical protein
MRMRGELTWHKVQLVGVEEGEGWRPGCACARRVLRRRRVEGAPQDVVDAER